jgi:secondary thiamine-phosphate synthase enzyme
MKTNFYFLFCFLLISANGLASPGPVCQTKTLNGEFRVKTDGPKFYDIQQEVENHLQNAFKASPQVCKDGLLHLFIMHTSAALGITESSDAEAKEDIMDFLDKIAPRGDKPGVVYKHSLEGPDDSPSHLKSVILNQSLVVPVAKNKLDLGKWQKIYLIELRDQQKERVIKFKYKAD